MSEKSSKKKTSQMSIRAQRLKKRQDQRRMLVIGLIVAAVILLILFLWKPISQLFNYVVPEQRSLAQVNFNTMGDPNAPVKLVEYADFQCPFCKRFADETEQQIIDNYVKTGKVYYTYVPSGPGGISIGPESEAAANAAFCAAEQGKFWGYKDILYANHTGENVGDYPDGRLRVFAKEMGLDTQKFNDCFASKKYADKLAEGITTGQSLNVGGTPTFVFNDGEAQLEGAQDYAAFVQQIEALLNK
jgi:protein-disulfide isomerase